MARHQSICLAPLYGETPCSKDPGHAVASADVYWAAFLAAMVPGSLARSLSWHAQPKQHCTGSRHTQDNTLPSPQHALGLVMEQGEAA